MSPMSNSTANNNHQIWIVEDDADLRGALVMMLKMRGFSVAAFADSPEFFDKYQSVVNSAATPSLLIIDIGLPSESGYQVSRRVRGDGSQLRVPIIHLSGGGADQKYSSIQAGADDFVVKPFSYAELTAKIDSLLRIHDKELKNASKMNTLKKFIDPGVAQLVVDRDQEDILAVHDREVAVVFCDLRGFSNFAARFSRRDALAALDTYYAVVGQACLSEGGTLGYLAGDGIMVFFNDPIPNQNFRIIAASFAVSVRQKMQEVVSDWCTKGYGLGLGMGIDWGPASIGRIGFDQFSQYTVIGNTVNFASRLCAEADAGEILISAKSLAMLPAERLHFGSPREIEPKGFGKSLVYNLSAIKETE